MIRKTASLSARLRILLGIVLTIPAFTLATSDSRADTETEIMATVQAFLHEQTRDKASQVQIRVFDSAASFPACLDPQPFLARRSQQALSGDISVGVRCNGDAGNVRYLRARISLLGSYVTVAGDIPRGTLLEASMLERQQGNLDKLPPKAILESEHAVGQLTRRRLSAGTILQQQHLQRPSLIERGQPVTIESRGRGFVVTREGEALESGGRGDAIRVRITRRENLRAVVIAEDRVRVGEFQGASL
ncbi:MAG: flagellar basal body P-ring formation chaperone FlgA [Pseudohongiellaceae bacterium]